MFKFPPCSLFESFSLFLAFKQYKITAPKKKPSLPLPTLSWKPRTCCLGKNPIVGSFILISRHVPAAADDDGDVDKHNVDGDSDGGDDGDGDGDDHPDKRTHAWCC